MLRSFCLVYGLAEYSCFTTRGSAVCIAHLSVFLSVLSESALVSIWVRSQHFKQCCGSMTFGLDLDLDPNPAIFIIDPQGANKKLTLKKKFFC